MSEIQIIESAVIRTARRRRLQRACRGFWQGLFAGSCLWLTAVVAYKVAPLPDRTLLIAAAIAASLLPAGFLF